tara:strand:+ start:183 stop:881 length:699 start_codon:yes stop_codon:yes gene_type:complete
MAIVSVGNINIEVTHKHIKNIHLSVHPPNGKVTISAPSRMDLNSIRVYALGKLGWIKNKQKKIVAQKREPIRDYINRESHYFKGERYLMKIINVNAAPKVELSKNYIELYVRPNSTREKRMQVMDNWYREYLKIEISKLIDKWESKIGVKVSEFRIKKMKTRWGSCNINKKRIWLNLELAKKPFECLEYVVIHEMVHLLEAKHNNRFYILLDKFYPRWKHSSDLLKLLPISP